MRTLRDELELRRKTEIHEIEERKNSQINTLMKNHEKAFSDIKNYYNDITLNNLALINSLKVSSFYLIGCIFFYKLSLWLTFSYERLSICYLGLYLYHGSPMQSNS